MASPPITIGPFTNVPAPGSPIRSDWPQQLTQYAVDTTVVVPAAKQLAGGNVNGLRVLGDIVFPTNHAARSYLILWWWTAAGQSALGSLEPRLLAADHTTTVATGFPTPIHGGLQTSGFAIFRFSVAAGAAGVAVAPSVVTSVPTNVDGYAYVIG